MKQTTNNLPAWDLSDLYNGIKDTQIEKDLKKYKKNALELRQKYRGKRLIRNRG